MSREGMKLEYGLSAPIKRRGAARECEEEKMTREKQNGPANAEKRERGGRWKIG